jgi:hypothetical protein
VSRSFYIEWLGCGPVLDGAVAPGGMGTMERFECGL